MLAQQQEIGGLRAQLAQSNQGPPDAGVPPAPVNQPVAPKIPNADPVIPENPIAFEDRTKSNGLSSLRLRRKRKPKLNRIRQDQTNSPNRKVKGDLSIKTATMSSMAIIIRKENGIQEDRGINRILPKRRMLLITTVIPLIKNVEGSTREIAVLEPIAASYVARKATMLSTATLISKACRTIREVRDINFIQHN
ncbi:hypothetical protein TIFTF001_034265 [Ficus carica]|uniref:Uncharacterized protein n=1 Tax=Ficus carica TaxID=3494 RepID=A0AA88E3F0_FICCA|nr:hypothetical protein TIFTF001_034265 [Ficus carica]